MKKTNAIKKEKKESSSSPKTITAEQLIEKSKQEIIQEFATKKGDTGSPEVQVALLTQKIFKLVKHLEQNPKDNHSRRGLLKIVSKRRRLLRYLQEKDKNRYQNLIARLSLGK